MFSRKSKGHVQARDILHGTFVRFDNSGRTGKIQIGALRQLCGDLKISNISDSELTTLSTWFDNNGSGLFDYNSCIELIFGEDVSTKTLVLPKLGMSASGSVSMLPTLAMTKSMQGPASGSLADLSDLNQTQKKNLEVIESEATKFNRNKLQRKAILAERRKIAAKIEEIENQQKYIIDDYNVRHPKLTW